MVITSDTTRKTARKMIRMTLLAAITLLGFLACNVKTAIAVQQQVDGNGCIVKATVLDGNVVLNVPAKLVADDVTSLSDGVSTCVKTYEVDLYVNYNAAAQTYSLSTNRYDSSKSVRSFLTIAYKKNSAGHVLLTAVSGHWTISDSTVSVTSALLRYGCGNAVVGNPAVERYVSNYFSYSTGYQAYVPMGAAAASTGANLTLSLRHGSSRWTSMLKCNI